MSEHAEHPVPCIGEVASASSCESPADTISSTFTSAKGSWQAEQTLRASRWAKIGGWIYTAAELAVILYFAEDIEHSINKYVDRRAARVWLVAGIRFGDGVNLYGGGRRGWLVG